VYEGKLPIFFSQSNTFLIYIFVLSKVYVVFNRNDPK
jgi:hypothetical protein